jgi:DNA repair photolyase
VSKHFDDQPIVKGADVIYRPAGNAGEYAPLATNPYKGCGHACAYCYVPLATHQDRPTFNAGAVPRERFLHRLLRDIRRYRDAGICDGHPAEQVFITFSSDPFHPGLDLQPTYDAMVALREGGMAFCTLSKGGRRALPFADLYRPERDAYACTLTSLDERFSAKWERHAAPPGERVEVLREFHERGIFTWVSLEPTLDTDASIEIVEKTHRFVDLYKIGKANYVPTLAKLDWERYTGAMIALCRAVGVAHYIKRDLQPHLPPGYPNPLRVPQHH